MGTQLGLLGAPTQAPRAPFKLRSGHLFPSWALPLLDFGGKRSNFNALL